MSAHTHTDYFAAARVSIGHDIDIRLARIAAIEARLDQMPYGPRYDRLERVLWAEMERLDALAIEENRLDLDESEIEGLTL